MAHDPLLAQRVRRIVMRHAGSAEIHMFGGVCFTVHGNMCCGVANDDLMLRLGDAASSALDEPGVRPMANQILRSLGRYCADINGD
ncbi:MAG: TfoX/Sxy family protein [Planctomycetes bacterium]|nr:TfoX/Sxy family protein [Planctomycetota bacterium]